MLLLCLTDVALIFFSPLSFHLQNQYLG